MHLARNLAQTVGLVEYNTNTLIEFVIYPQNLNLRLKNRFFIFVPAFWPITLLIANRFKFSHRIWKEERKTL